MVSPFVCSLQAECDWFRVLGFGLGFVAGFGFVPTHALAFAWTAHRLKKAIGRATWWGAILAAASSSVAAWSLLLLPLLPLGLTPHRQLYTKSAVWGVLTGFLIHTARERWQSGRRG